MIVSPIAAMLLGLLLQVFLLAVPAVEAASAVAEPCTATMARTDIDSDDHLTFLEFRSFAYQEALKTPAVVSLIGDSELWPTLVQELFEVLSNEDGYIDIRGASTPKSEWNDPKQESALNLICERTKMIVVNVIQESIAESDSVVRQGPFIGEAKTAGGGITGTDLAAVKQAENEQEEEEEEEDDEPEVNANVTEGAITTDAELGAENETEDLETEDSEEASVTTSNASNSDPDNDLGEDAEEDIIDSNQDGIVTIEAGILISNTQNLTVANIAADGRDMLTAFVESATDILDDTPQQEQGQQPGSEGGSDTTVGRPDGSQQGENQNEQKPPQEQQQQPVPEEGNDTTVSRPEGPEEEEESQNQNEQDDQNPPLPRPENEQGPEGEGGSDTTVGRPDASTGGGGDGEAALPPPPPTRQRMLRMLQNFEQLNPQILNIENADCPDDVQGGDSAVCHVVTLSFSVPTVSGESAANIRGFFFRGAQQAIEDGTIQATFDEAGLSFTVEEIFDASDVQDGGGDNSGGYYGELEPEQENQESEENEENARDQVMFVGGSFQLTYTATSAFDDIGASNTKRMQLGRAISLYLEEALIGVIDSQPSSQANSTAGNITGPQNLPGQGHGPDPPANNSIVLPPGGRPQNETDVNQTKRLLQSHHARLLRVVFNARNPVDYDLRICPREPGSQPQAGDPSQGVIVCYDIKFVFELQLIGEDGEATYEEVVSAVNDPVLLESYLTEFIEGELEYTVNSLSIENYHVGARPEKDDPYGEQQGSRPTGGKPVLVNSSFLIASPDGKTADELRADPAAVQGLGRAFSLLVQRVARGVGRGRPGSPPSSNQQEGMNPGLGGNNTVGGMPQGIPGQQGTQDGGTSNQRPVMGAEQGQQTMGRPQGEQPGPPDNESNGTQTSAQNVTPLARRRLLRRSTVWDRTRALFEHDRRYLAVELDTASATIYDFEDTPCTEDDGAVAASRQGGAEQNCITVFGKFRIIVDEDEDIAEVYATYVEATNAYIANGTLEETLLEVDPDTNFTVLGVSDVVDENFDAFEEIAVVDDGMSSESDTDTETPTPSNVSTTPTPTNASSSTSENDEEDTSSAIALTLKFVSLLSATFMSVLIL